MKDKYYLLLFFVVNRFFSDSLVLVLSFIKKYWKYWISILMDGMVRSFRKAISEFFFFISIIPVVVVIVGGKKVFQFDRRLLLLERRCTRAQKSGSLVYFLYNIFGRESMMWKRPYLFLLHFNSQVFLQFSWGILFIIPFPLPLFANIF